MSCTNRVPLFAPARGGVSIIKLLAVASAGGHWEELMLLRPALDAFDVEYATTYAGFGARERLEKVHILPDSNRHRPFRTLWCIVTAWRVVRASRPDFVVTTGALPGLICAVVGRVHGARTIWVDSIANSEKVSMSGWCARWFSGLWLTQWEHLAHRNGPGYDGALL